MRRPCRLVTIVAAVVVGATWSAGAPAREEARPLASAIADAIESCVDSSTMRFGAESRRALLDTDDANAVRAAIVSRYPKVEDDGLAPQRIVLWRHPDYGWVYVALLVNPAKPGEVCFTATFGADKFEVSPGLIRKYFGADA